MQSPEQRVTGILELASGTIAGVTKAIESHGGKIRSAAAGANSLTFEITAQHLPDLADLDDVVYVSTQEPYQS